MLLQTKINFWKKNSAPGSEAAPDTWLLQKKNDFLENVLPQAAKLPGTSGFFKKKSNFPQAAKLPGTSGFFKKKSIVWKRVLPQAAKLPGTSGFFKKKSDF